MSASIRLIASVLALVLLAQSAAAGSLWAKATRRSRNLYALKPIKRLFNGCGINVVASPDDEFFFSPGKPEIAV